MEALLALLFTFGLMYLLLIRPQQRRMRAHQAVVAALEPGDEVVTAGGIHGTIISVDDDAVRLEIAPGVVILCQRGGVSQRVGPFREELDEPDDDDEYDEDDEYDADEDDEDDEDGDEDGDDEPVVEDEAARKADDTVVEVVEVTAEEITVQKPEQKPEPPTKEGDG